MDQMTWAWGGHPDAARLAREAILDRWLAGESLNQVAWDYSTMPAHYHNDAEAKLRQAVQERMGPSLTLCLVPIPWWRRKVTAGVAWLRGT